MAIKYANNSDWECRLTASPSRVLKNTKVELTVTILYQGKEDETSNNYNYTFSCKAEDKELQVCETTAFLETPSFKFIVPPTLPDGKYEIKVTALPKMKDADASPGGENPPPDKISGSITLYGSTTLEVVSNQIEVTRGQANVTLQRSASYQTVDQSLWVAIRNRTSAIQFDRYQRFINGLFCGNEQSELYKNEIGLSIQGPYAYSLLKLATQVFLTLECGVFIHDDKYELFDPERESIRLGQPSVSIDDLTESLKKYLQLDNQALPYLDRIVTALLGLDPARRDEVLPYCYGILQHRLTKPSLLELIWSYWQEEGMLVQTMNAITYRFQNMRSSPRDPLGELEIDPLRPLNNLLWGYIQDEHNRLTIPRRAYEYDHQYGLKLLGKAVPNMASADSRSKFIEAFHNLLYRTSTFYKADADTTVIADAFPLLNALREVHLLLAEGAHNQFGDLPWTSRAEMLTTQWLLARPEMREFLRGRHMVPYQEPWMGAVDCMKKLQGWTDTTVTHFHELALTGERIVLSMRYGDWSSIDNIEEQAKNWARYWKPEIQRYIHGYQTVTGVDLMADITDSRDASQRLLQPSLLLQRRLAGQSNQGGIPMLTRTVRTVQQERSGFVELPMPGRRRLPRYQENE